MDTKLKNNKGFAAFFARHWAAALCILTSLALALGLLLYGSLSFSASGHDYERTYQNPDIADSFATELAHYSTMLYWLMQQQEAQDYTLNPAEVFFPEYDPIVALNDEARAAIDRDNYATSEEYEMAVDSHRAIMEANRSPNEPDAFSQNLQTLMNDLSQSFDEQWGGTGWFAVDTATGAVLGTHGSELTGIVGANTDAYRDLLADKYDYCAVLRWGEDGRLGVPMVFGAAQGSMAALQNVDLEYWLLGYSGMSDFALAGPMQGPRNLAVVFPVPNGMENRFYMNKTAYDIEHLYQSGFPGIWFVLTLATMAGAMLLWTYAGPPKSGLRQNPAMRLAPELSLIGLGIAFMGDNDLLHQIILLFQGNYTRALAERGVVNVFGWLLSYGFFTCVLAGIFLIGMAAAGSLMQVKELGFRGYLSERSVLVWLSRRFSTQLQTLWHWITDIDLSDSSNRAIIKILVANFIILALFCSIWVFGIFGLLLYSIVLYFVLRNYARRLKHNYANLLEATGQMAAGRLDAHIEGDFGVFTPLGRELVEVQRGFTLAVQEHTRSQRMKTELISNVSHDLKTPLTAIITYVDLLKKEGISEEERRSYIATLDTKSQRLKTLIEDLFEMSKASSGNIVLHPTRVDLPALVRQVELEARDELAAANIEFRYNFPPGKLELLLDGEKTSRIFENLILNVAKYGMPGTRAYVTIVAGEKLVTLEMKNVSKNELTFDSGEITDRFIRGDTARSSEGSGLGLAISKSFAEAQGAQFKVVTDGDMFKAYITFSRVPGTAVPRMAPPAAENIAPPTAAPQPDVAAAFSPQSAFTAQSNTYKPASAAFSEPPPQPQAAYSPPRQQGTYPPPRQQAGYPGGYPTGSYPGGHYAPPQGQPSQGLADTFNQMADAVVDVASSTANAVASAARHAAGMAKQASMQAGSAARQAGGAARQAAQGAAQNARDEKIAAKQMFQQAKAEAKAAARRMRQEARDTHRRLKQEATAFTRQYARQAQENAGQPQENRPPHPYQQQGGPAGYAPPSYAPPSYTAPNYTPPSYAPPSYTAPEYRSPFTPEAPPPEVLHPEQLFKNIPEPPAFGVQMPASDFSVQPPELHLTPGVPVEPGRNGYTPDLRLTPDVPPEHNMAGYAPDLRLTPDMPPEPNMAGYTPDLRLTPDVPPEPNMAGYAPELQVTPGAGAPAEAADGPQEPALRPELELFPMPELIIPGEEPPPPTEKE